MQTDFELRARRGPMARPKLRLDLTTADNKENQTIVKDLNVKDLRKKSSTDVVAVRELQAFQTQVPSHPADRKIGPGSAVI